MYCGAAQVRVFVGGSPAGMVRFEREGRQSRRLALAEQPPDTVRVEFRLPEELTLPRREGGRLGAAIAAFWASPVSATRFRKNLLS
jgi:hypothetical protein